jgi:PAS domain S-box-containing protein
MIMHDEEGRKKTLPPRSLSGNGDECSDGDTRRVDYQRFADIVEFLPDATFVIDDTTKVIAWNKAMETLTGVSKRDIIDREYPAYGVALYKTPRPMLVDCILSAEHDADGLTLYESVTRKEDAIYAESFVPPAYAGRGAFLWGKASPLYDTTGRIIGVIESIRDITERKQTEDLYRRVANDLQIGLYIVAAGTILFANQHIPRYSGYSMDELLGSAIISYVHPDDREMVREYAVEMLKGERSTPYEYRIIDKSGRVKWLMETVSPITHQGRPATLGNTIDITELREVKQEVEQMKSLEASILSSVPHALFGLEECRIFFANQSVEAVLGWRPDELMGKNTRVFHRSDDEYERCKEKLHAEMKGNDRWVGEPEVPFVRKDGKEIFCRMSVSRIGDRREGMKRIVCALEDITGDRQAEEALRQGEERYRAIVEEQIELVSRWRPDRTLTFVNDSYCRFFGKARNEMLGKPFDGNMPEEDLRKMKEHITRLTPQDPVATIEHRVYGADGTIRWTQWSDRVIMDRDGTVVEIQSVGRDITDQKRIQEELQIKDSAIKSSITPIVIADLGMDLTYANDAFLKLWGYDTIDDVIGTNVRHHLARPAEGDSVIDRMKNDEGWVGEIMARKKNGDTFYASVTTSVVKGDEGSPVAVMVSFADMTEKKQSEKTMRQLQKMEAIGTLAGGIAHDFNNILMGIEGHAALMLLDVKEDHPFYARLKSQEEIIASGARLSRQLLSFARGGKYEVALVNLNDIILKSLDMFGRTKKEISVYHDLDPLVWKVEADQGQIEQVLLNLLVNAWQAMPGGGRITVTTGNETILSELQSIPWAQRGNYATISVSDTGIGMDEETQKMIFEPFFTTKERGHGTGLGLASVYGILKNHGGFILVDSEAGKGSTFTIYLPASTGEVLRDNGDSAMEVARGTETVLIIDDEEMILDVATAMLEELGYTVIRAGNGSDGLTIFEENRDVIDLVILDMIMPGMGGKEVFKRLKDIREDVRILIASGYSNKGDQEDLIEKGCDGFIQKPFSLIPLSQVIREILDGGKTGGPVTGKRMPSAD